MRKVLPYLGILIQILAAFLGIWLFRPGLFLLGGIAVLIALVFVVDKLRGKYLFSIICLRILQWVWAIYIIVFGLWLGVLLGAFAMDAPSSPWIAAVFVFSIIFGLSLIAGILPARLIGKLIRYLKSRNTQNNT